MSGGAPADQPGFASRQVEGSVEITERAQSYAKKLLSEYQEPKLDEAKDEELLDYIARREREIPASDELNQSY